jgi:hypothetical protein
VKRIFCYQRLIVQFVANFNRIGSAQLNFNELDLHLLGRFTEKRFFLCQLHQQNATFRIALQVGFGIVRMELKKKIIYDLFLGRNAAPPFVHDIMIPKRWRLRHFRAQHGNPNA